MSSTPAPAPSSRHDAVQLERRDAHRGRVINRSAALQKRREEFAANARPVGAGTSTIYDWTTSLTASPIQLKAFDGAIEELHDAVSVGNHEVWGDPLPSHLQYRKRDEEPEADTADAHTIAKRGVGGPGSPLPHGEVIQKAFGRHDLSDVKAHLGGHAQEASAALGAEAYATGSDIAFAGTPTLHTAAHEAAHIIQQRAGVSLKDGIGESGDRYERHADEVADAVVRGQSAEPILDRMAGSGGAGGPAIQRDGGEAGPVAKGDKGGRRPKNMAPLPDDIDDQLAKACAVYQGKVSAQIGSDNLPALTFDLGGITWPMDVGCPTSMSDADEGVYRFAVTSYATVRRGIVARFGGEEEFATAVEALEARSASGPAYDLGDAAAGRQMPQAMRASGLRHLNDGFVARYVSPSPHAKGGLALLAGNPDAVKYDQNVLRYASGAATEAEAWRQSLDFIAGALSAAKSELIGLYRMRLGGKTVYVKAGEEIPFFTESERQLGEDVEAVHRQYKLTQDTMIAQMNWNAEHRFASFLAGADEGGPSMALWTNASNAVSIAKLRQADHARYVGGDPHARYEHLQACFEALSQAADDCLAFDVEVDLWKDALLTSAQALLELSRRVRDGCIAILGVMTGNALKPVLGSLGSTMVAEGAKSVVTQMSDKGTLNPFAVSGMKVTQDMATATFAKAILDDTKYALNVDNLLGHDLADEALEAAIGEALKESIGQTLTKEEFLYNVKQAVVAKAVGG